jgi:hypothetical protein
VIGISPATNEKEHTEKYGLPLGACSAVIYTGFGFSGRNIILARSCDAVIIINGRAGTLMEFAASYAEEKVVGALTGTRGVADKARELEGLFNNEFNTKIAYDSNPKRLVEKVVAMLREKP